MRPTRSALCRSSIHCWTRDGEAEILPLCEELGIGFVAYSSLGRGFLTGNVTDNARLRAGDARRNMPRSSADSLRRNLALVDKLKELAAVEKCTPAQLAELWPEVGDGMTG
jgi:aryl-alcohol dehydrogenase-like predicted oxidoreductase